MDRLTLLSYATHQPRRAMVYRHEGGNAEVYIECAKCSQLANSQIENERNRLEAYEWTSLAMAETDVVRCRHCNIDLEFE